MVKLDRCVGNWNTLNDLSRKVMCSKQNKRFKSKVIKGFKVRNESKILIKYISCECKCKFDGRKCNSNQK